MGLRRCSYSAGLWTGAPVSLCPSLHHSHTHHRWTTKTTPFFATKALDFIEKWRIETFLPLNTLLFSHQVEFQHTIGGLHLKTASTGGVTVLGLYPRRTQTGFCSFRKMSRTPLTHDPFVRYSLQMLCKYSLQSIIHKTLTRSFHSPVIYI